MNALLLHSLYAALAPAFALALLFLGRNPHPSRKRIFISVVLAIVFLLLPIKGIASVRWVALLEPNPSVTLTALLGIGLIARAGGLRFFGAREWRSAWIFGTVTSFLLYPTALGLTRWDAYALGWGPLVPLGTALVATVLLARNNHFGVVLLLALAGMAFRPMESTNAWDALIDPCYAILSLIISITLLVRYRISTGHSGNARKKALP